MPSRDSAMCPHAAECHQGIEEGRWAAAHQAAPRKQVVAWPPQRYNTGSLLSLRTTPGLPKVAEISASSLLVACQLAGLQKGRQCRLCGVGCMFPQGWRWGTIWHCSCWWEAASHSRRRNPPWAFPEGPELRREERPPSHSSRSQRQRSMCPCPQRGRGTQGNPALSQPALLGHS